MRAGLNKVGAERWEMDVCPVVPVPAGPVRGEGDAGPHDRGRRAGAGNQTRVAFDVLGDIQPDAPFVTLGSAASAKH